MAAYGTMGQLLDLLEIGDRLLAEKPTGSYGSGALFLSRSSRPRLAIVVIFVSFFDPHFFQRWIFLALR